MTPDYGRNDRRGWEGDPKRGAAMGRNSSHKPGFSGRLHLRRVRIDSQGYDPNGTYFGHGGRGPLYWCVSEGQEVDYVLRARDRDEAKAIVRGKYPGAKFFR